MPAIGDFIYGGYFAGWIDTTKGNIIPTDASQTGKRYMLIVAPKSLETTKTFKSDNTFAPAATHTRWDGLSATAAMAADAATYPAADYCAGLAAPSDGGSAWYLPALDELELIYRNLKPTTTANDTSAWASFSGEFPYGDATYNSGYNPSSDPPGAKYTTSVPGQTALVAFRSGGAQALASGSVRSSTEVAEVQAWVQSTTTGTQDRGTNKAAAALVRPVRRVENVAPNAPVLGSVGTIDRAVTNRFPWTFSDPDVGDSQSKFDLRYRLIGAPTWTDVTGTTPNQFWDATAGTFTAGDYEWQVRTYDSQGVVGPYSPSSFFTAADAPASPTITDPINGATVNASATVTWSTPVQDSYQVRRVADNAGTADTSTVYFDTGEVVDDSTRTLSVAFPTNNRFEHVQVRVKDGGLWSPWTDARVQVSWSPPAAPVVTLTTYTASIGVAITNPTPTGGEPTVVYNDVYLSAAGVPEYRAATMVAPNGAWLFETPQSGLDYTFRVLSVASNGTTSETVVS